MKKKLYSFYQQTEDGLTHLNTVKATTKREALKQMGSSLLFRIRRKQEIICLTSEQHQAITLTEINKALSIKK